MKVYAVERLKHGGVPYKDRLFDFGCCPFGSRYTEKTVARSIKEYAELGIPDRGRVVIFEEVCEPQGQK